MSVIFSKKQFLFKIWLITSISLVYLMIIIGGLTRLTDSGLSITEWELFNGLLPPTTSDKWNYYFDLYKKIPQYFLADEKITLDQFKIIFYWEYIHRVLGRLIGIFFLFGLLYFFLKKTISYKYLLNLFLLFFLVCLQGFIGWYMVQSGLTNNISVSHYRLSIHLTMALIIISVLVWNYLNLHESYYKNFFSLNSENLLIKILIFFLFIQIIIGAFVSGLDAGLIYQTWPLMNNAFFPDDLNGQFLSNILNFSNHSYVQFIHRSLAYIIFLLALLIGILIFMNNKKNIYKPYFFMLAILFLQIFLGVLTLISGLNFYLAISHQFSGVLLVISSLNLYIKSI